MPEPINELFADLDKRLETLSNYKKHIDVTGVFEEFFLPVSISLIARDLWQYGDNGVLKLKATLREIENLLNKKESLVDKISFTVGINTFEDPYENKPEQKRAAQLREYPALKSELKGYKVQLVNAAKELSGLDITQDKLMASKNDKDVNKATALSNLSKNLKRTNTNNSHLTKDQAAIFFQYLMDFNIIHEFDSTSISKIVSELTGHSFNTLRQDSFRVISDNKFKVPGREKKNNPNPNNLQVVKNALDKIIDAINKEIVTANKK